jgi:hypothetical protein
MVPIWQGPLAEFETTLSLSRFWVRRRCPISTLYTRIMVFGLTIGTERSIALQVRTHVLLSAQLWLTYTSQQSIQDELTRRGFSPDAGMIFFCCCEL